MVSDVTLVASVIAATTSIVGVTLQIWNARKTETLKFAATVHQRLLEAQNALFEHGYPEELKDLPFRIKQNDEREFLIRNISCFCDTSESYALIAERLLDAFDKDIRLVIEHYLRDFRSEKAAFDTFAANYAEDPDKDRLYENSDEFRELACDCHALVESIRQGIRVQIDRMSYQLMTGRRRWDYDFADSFVLNSRVRRVFNPNWQDWP